MNVYDICFLCIKLDFDVLVRDGMIPCKELIE